jgi:UDP-N-acetylmuramate: L-alanyl-gamma-D-glutamyl-meso-diaminopimelate ligase
MPASLNIFADASPKGGALVFNDDDWLVSVICKKERLDVNPIGYQAHPSIDIDGKTYLVTAEGAQVPVPFFGEHNLYNANAAKETVALLGVQPEEFYAAMSTFKGAAKRLEVVPTPHHTVYRDFAHAPSKVKASVKAVVGHHPTEKTAGVFELHTFSSLDPEFVAQYAGSLAGLEVAAIYLDSEVLAKKGKGLQPQQVLEAFDRPGLTILSSAQDLKDFFGKHAAIPVWVWMSSGRLGGLNVSSLYA